VGGYLVEVIFVSLATHLMHFAQESAENLQKDRHMMPKCALHVRKTAFLRFINLNLKFCFWGLAPDPTGALPLDPLAGDYGPPDLLKPGPQPQKSSYAPG